MSDQAAGVVIQVMGPHCEVKAGRDIIRCVAKRTLIKAEGPLVVGDRVRLEHHTPNEARIIGLEPRRTILKRARSHQGGGRAQLLAANADQLVVVASVARPSPNAGLIDRYLVAAWKEGLSPILCFNKIDLEMDGDARATIAVFDELDIPKVRTSTVSGEGLEVLARLLEGHSSVFAGLSGVGKTSLARLILGDPDLRVGKISESSGRGRHTTTSARLLELPAELEGNIIDLPGQRVFGLTGLQAEDLYLGFPELRDLEPCLLPNCTHSLEAGCEIRQALADGRVSERRMKGFLRIKASLKEGFDPSMSRS